MTTPLIGPDGKPYTLTSDDPADLESARAQGFHVEGERSPHDIGEDTAQAGLAGVARGATFGLSDAALSSDKENLERLKEEHPIASGAGELAGAVLSPVNKVGALVEGERAASVAGRLGQKAVGGAAVGSLFGAGSAVSDAALGDSDMTADKVLAHVGLGALLGGAGGGVGGAIEEGIAGLLPKLGKSLSGAQDSLDEFADDRWLKAAGGIQNEIKKIPAAEHGAVADAIRTHLQEPGSTMPRGLDDALASLEGERGAVGQKVIQEAGITDAGGLAPHLDRDEAVAALEKAQGAHGQRMGAVMDAADQMGAKPSYSQVLSRLDGFEAGLNPAERDLAAKPLGDLRRYLDEMGSKPVGSQQNSFAALNDLKSTITKGINYKTEDNVAIGIKKQIAGILRDEIDTQLAPQIGSDLSKEWLAAKGEFGALSRAEDALGRKASTGMDAIRALAEDSAHAPPSLPRLSALEHGRNLLQRGIDRKLGNRWLSASDYLSGIGAGVMHGGPMGALTGLATSVAHKFMRENGAAVIAKMADRLATSPALKTMAQSFAKTLPQTAPQLGNYGPILLNAIAQSPETALATHMVLAQTDPHYSATAQLAGLTPENQQEHTASLVRAHGISEVGASTRKVDADIARHLDAVFKGSGSPVSSKAMNRQDFGAMRMRRDSEAAHEKRADEIRQLASNPDALLDRVSKNLSGVGPVAPGVAAALSNRAMTAIQYLAQSCAVPPKGGPLAHDWTPPEADRQEFAAKLEVVEEPLSVLRSASAGTLTEGQVEALRAVYPRLAQEISDKAIEKLTTAKHVPYSARLMVNLITGIDPDGTFSAESIASNQSAILAGPKKSEAQGSQGAPQAGNLSLAQRSATPSQRREMEPS